MLLKEPGLQSFLKSYRLLALQAKLLLEKFLSMAYRIEAMSSIMVDCFHPIAYISMKYLKMSWRDINLTFLKKGKIIYKWHLHLINKK